MTRVQVVTNAEPEGLANQMDISRYINSIKARDFRIAVVTLRSSELAATPFEEHGNLFGVGGNTFRAFVGQDNRPSELYRAWAADVCKKLNAEYLEKRLDNEESFARWHRSLAGSLQRYWLKFETRELSFAHQYKIVDLFVKWLSRHDWRSEKVTSGFEQFANCAVDRQSLSRINECYSFALPMPNPRMGDVQGLSTYLFVQELITNFAVQNGGTRLLFDFFAWRKGS